MMRRKMVILPAAVLILTAGIQAQSVKDIDGNDYKTVTIGTQIWMAENLRTTRYSDGTPIPKVTGADAWAALNTPAWCWYNNDQTEYGILYNWYAVDPDSNGNKNICPDGWHVPDDEDWTILINYLSNNGYGFENSKRDIAKAMAATSGWAVHDIPGNVGHDQGSNNSSGFTALPSGYRNFLGAFNYRGSYAYWWSSTAASPSTAYYRFIHNYYSYVGRSNFRKQNGFPIRCVCDTPAGNTDY